MVSARFRKNRWFTQKGDNTYVIGIKGNFDDVQTGVKKIFGDKELEKRDGKRGRISVLIS